MDQTVKVPTEEEKKKGYIDGIKKTIIPGIFGIIGGIMSFHLAGETQARAGFGFAILVIMVLLQKYVFPLVNIKVEEFEAKDWIYTVFMTTTFWFVSWTLLLN
ncbi:MAG: hypothetical protein BME93_04050 [Methanosarcinales archaeon Met12]|nr:MAG: hypothetical protein BME93_04050 [Methanosarcinales archaeon Met12]